MEVHHHPHSGSDSHLKKSFKSYFWEFLMIFIAVTLGFFAEQLREEYIEHKKATEYVHSFYEDLKTDTATLSDRINFETKKIAELNTLQSCYDSLLINQQPASLLNIIKNSLSNNPFRMNKRTLSQLSNAGGYRLLNKEDADSIISYAEKGDRLDNYQSTIYQQAQDNLRNALNDALDFTAYSNLYGDVANNPSPDATEIKEPLFASTNKAVLNKYFIDLFQYLRVIVEHRNGLKGLNKKAAIQIGYFKKKYHLE